MLEQKDLEMIADIVSSSLEPVRKDIKELQTKVDQNQKEIQDVRVEVKDVRAEVQNVREDLGKEIKDVRESLGKEIKDVRAEVKDVREEIREVRMTLENETNRNIKIIAEGHLDLNRKLDEALRGSAEREMLIIRVTSLENEVRRLKEKNGQIA